MIFALKKKKKSSKYGNGNWAWKAVRVVQKKRWHKNSSPLMAVPWTQQATTRVCNRSASRCNSTEYRSLLILSHNQLWKIKLLINILYKKFGKKPCNSSFKALKRFNCNMLVHITSTWPSRSAVSVPGRKLSGCLSFLCYTTKKEQPSLALNLSIKHSFSNH